MGNREWRRSMGKMEQTAVSVWRTRQVVREAFRVHRKLRRLSYRDRVELMRLLPDEVRHEVARIAAEGRRR